jgi:hypothetical protein
MLLFQKPPSVFPNLSSTGAFMERVTRSERYHLHVSQIHQKGYHDKINVTILSDAVGIATSYGLDGPGDRIPVGTRFSTLVQTDTGPTPSSI